MITAYVATRPTALYTFQKCQIQKENAKQQQQQQNMNVEPSKPESCSRPGVSSAIFYYPLQLCCVSESRYLLFC